MNPDEIVREIYEHATHIPEPFSSLTDDAKEQAKKLLEIFERMESEHGELPYRDLLLPMLLSKNGMYDKALAFTHERYEEEPGFERAVACANAARRSGDLEQAIEMFTQASTHDPTDLTCWLDIGDIYLEDEQFAQAMEAYERVLESESDHQWALPSAFYCRHQLGIEGNWIGSLKEVATQEGCTCGMQDCLTSIFGGYGSESGIARAEYLLSKDEN